MGGEYSLASRVALHRGCPVAAVARLGDAVSRDVS